MNFKIQFTEWVAKNRKKILEHIVGIFKKNLRSDPNRWSFNDYRNWVLSGEHWTFDVEI